MAAIEASLQPVAAVGIGIYVMAVLFGTKIPYDMMIARGVELSLIHISEPTRL